MIFLGGIGSMEGVGSRSGGSTETFGRNGPMSMFWKILGVVAVVWLVLIVVGALVKALFPILMISLVVFGLYLLYKAVSGSKSTVDKL